MLFLEFLAVGSWSFWVILAVSAIVMSELMDTDHPGYATALAVGLAIVLSVFGDLNLYKLIKDNPLTVLEYVIGYFIVGTAWGMIKWGFWLKKIRSKIDELKIKFPNTWRNEVTRVSWPMSLPPKVAEHKTMIVGWMSLWPASMVWTLLRDPVRWLFEEIYSMLGNMMQRLSNHVFKDLDI